MLISEIYKTDNIILNLQSITKNDLFSEIVNFLVKAENLNIKEEIFTALWNREKKMTTGIAPNVAIPHAHIKDLGKTIGILGVSQKGIEYESLDKKPVHLVLMLIGDEKDAAGHLNILKTIAMFLNIPDFYNSIISCTTPLEVNNIILKFENSNKK